LTYTSETTCRKEQYAKEEALWENGREINRALKYATPQEKKQIEDAVTSAMSVAQQRLAKAISEDDENKKNIAKAYREQIEEAQALAKQAHEAALEKWEKDCEQQYEKACNLMRTSTTQDGFRKAKTLFATMHSYRDSMEKAKECRALEEKFAAAKKRRELLTKEMAALMTERNQLGVFAVKRRSEIDARLAEIRKEFG
jgi:hypothetical protein